MERPAPSPIDTMFAEAQALADAARRYFDGPGVAARARLATVERTAVAAEMLRVTTRLMAMVAWLLRQQAVAAEEIAATPGDRLDPQLDADSSVPAALAEPGRSIALASRTLYARVAALTAKE